MRKVLDEPVARRLVEALLADDPEHAIVLLDPRGQIVGWLGASDRLFGYSAEEALGRHLSELFTPEDRARHQAAAELDAARRVGRAEDDRWHLRRDGAAVWVTGTLTALNDADGRLIGFAKLLRDRTDLRSHLETLETRLAGVEQRLEAATVMMRTLGHELRNPLAPMLNVATILERSGASAPSLSLPASILKRQIAVLQRLADDLMDFSRLDAGRLQLQLTSFDVRDLLRDVTDSLAPAAVQRGIHIELLLPEVEVELLADRERLQQVLVNLVDNALRHNRAGSRVVLRVSEEPPDTVIRVEDDGVGIAPDVLPRIFELFARGGTTPAALQGMGIGLALARQIVELHGGSIEARSAGLGKGSAFGIRLPSRGQGATMHEAAAAGPGSAPS